MGVEILVDPQHRYSNESETAANWDIYDEFKLKKHFLHGLYKNIFVLQGLSQGK